MGKLIKDDFTDLKVSRQRKAQLRHRRDGFCEKCWRPALEKKDGRFAVYCEFHARKQVIKRAKKKGLHRGFSSVSSLNIDLQPLAPF